MKNLVIALLTLLVSHAAIASSITCGDVTEEIQITKETQTQFNNNDFVRKVVDAARIEAIKYADGSNGIEFSKLIDNGDNPFLALGIEEGDSIVAPVSAVYLRFVMKVRKVFNRKLDCLELIDINGEDKAIRYSFDN